MSFGTGQSELEREVAESQNATTAAIKAGRALWLTGSKDNPYWQMLEFIRIANVVLKAKGYPKMRMLLTYDGSEQLTRGNS